MPVWCHMAAMVYSNRSRDSTKHVCCDDQTTGPRVGGCVSSDCLYIAALVSDPHPGLCDPSDSRSLMSFYNKHNLEIVTFLICETYFFLVCLFVCVHAARLGCSSESASSAPERRVHRLLSFQRYLHSSRLLRGIPQQIPLHILDEDYTGQAQVWNLQLSYKQLQFLLKKTWDCRKLFSNVLRLNIQWKYNRVHRRLPFILGFHWHLGNSSLIACRNLTVKARYFLFNWVHLKNSTKKILMTFAC